MSVPATVQLTGLLITLRRSHLAAPAHPPQRGIRCTCAAGKPCPGLGARRVCVCMQACVRMCVRGLCACP